MVAPLTMPLPACAAHLISTGRCVWHTVTALFTSLTPSGSLAKGLKHSEAAACWRQGTPLSHPPWPQMTARHLLGTDRGQDSRKGRDEGSDSKGVPKVKMERVWLRGAAEKLWWKGAMRAGVMWMLYGEGVIRKEWWNGCDEKGRDSERCGWSYCGIMVWWRKCDQKGTMECVLWKKAREDAMERTDVW